MITAFVLVLTVLVMAGCAGQQSRADSISLERAKISILEDAGLKAENVVFLSGELAQKGAIRNWEAEAEDND
ncbi:MAG: hypothetical protein IJD80_02245 [Oscillospiraceae bacterium]|nr:hypothetical protein [Oscillospiraceae bacterium]